MEIIISTKDNKVSLSTDVEICESERKKFDKNSDLVRNLQMDCHLEASRVKNILKITRTAGEWVNETDIKQFKNDVKSFVSALAKMPEEEPECPYHVENEAEAQTVDVEEQFKNDVKSAEAQTVDVEDLEFVKKMLGDINAPNDSPSHIVGALVIDTTTSVFCPEITGWGKMSHNLLKTMCELYVKTYDKG